MEHQQHFSHGLLYSVSPDDFQSLHLQDENKTNGFAWEELKPRVVTETVSEYTATWLHKAETLYRRIIKS